MIALAILLATAAANATTVSTTAVPLRLKGTEAPVVIVRVQGRDLPLQLDLGDGSTLVLHPEVLAALRTEPTGDSFKGFSMDGKIDTPIVRLDLIEFGDLKIPNVAARLDVHDEAFRQYKKTELGAVGFVGTGLFASGQILLDYSRSRLAVSLPLPTGKLRNLCRGQAVPFIERSWGLMTPVDTDVGPLEFGLDTGSPAIVMSRLAATAAHLATDLDNTEFRKFAVGGTNFGPQRIDIWEMPMPAGMAGLIGHPFFEDHVLCFDYPKRTLHIQ